MDLWTPKCTLPPKISASQVILYHKEINLPLDDLRAEFHSILAEHSKDIAENKAIKFLKIDNDSDYDPLRVPECLPLLDTA